MKHKVSRPLLEFVSPIIFPVLLNISLPTTQNRLNSSITRHKLYLLKIICINKLLKTFGETLFTDLSIFVFFLILLKEYDALA